MKVLDLFSAAAGGWSLGMHRAGFTTVAACEFILWRRALYSQNNPDVRMYDDVRTLTGRQLLSDLGFLPDVIVGSPPCQDISSANTKGKGVEGERSGLYFEAVRIIGEVRPRWFALENSANLRTRGADAVLAALEAIGYTCWAFVVSAGDIGANHERARSWLIGCDLAQLDAHPNDESQLRRTLNAEVGELPPVAGDTGHASCVGHEGGRAWRYGPNGHGSPPIAEGAGSASHSDQEGQEDGSMAPSLRQAEIADDGCSARWGDDRQGTGQMGICPGDSDDAVDRRADWSLDDLAHHLRVDAGLSSWVAQSRIAIGGPRGTSAASLIVDAFGDAVLPQIPEAIGRAILRTEAALSAVLG